MLRPRGLVCNDATLAIYRRINIALWTDYRDGRIDQRELPTERSRRLLAALGAHTRGAPHLGRDYLRAFAQRGDLLPFCRSTLRRLARRFRLGVVTNGIDHVQRSRLEASGLTGRFEIVVTSEGAGYAKPDPRIMQPALDALGLEPAQALYVGDNPEADGLAAFRAGIPFCWVDHGAPYPRRLDRPQLRIRSLPELAERLLDSSPPPQHKRG